MWVLPLSFKEILLGWHGSFVGKKCRNVWMTTPLCLFWSVWDDKNRIAFENEEISIQKINSFVCNFWFLTKLFIDEGLLPLINFFDWLGFKRGLVRFFVSPLFFCSYLLTPLVYSLYAVDWPLGTLFSFFYI